MIFFGLALIGIFFLANIKEKPFRMMEITGTHIRDRDVRDMPCEQRRGKDKRVVRDDTHSQVEIISSAMERALEVQSNLDSHFPSFIKPMIRSNVTGGFWLSLPKLFCEWHLPSHDSSITLVNENVKEYYTKYLPYRRGFSAGWKGFSIAHNLEEGDILVFHLVGACRMKCSGCRSQPSAFTSSCRMNTIRLSDNMK
ncbi:B3 domain-containing protein At5g42700-like [Primulina eburnea]|uniref:B3 domain-containing protein At5g42700-like n=1 Tax=Primulina eburnea TaxID=1245227 RepID=UPI003C6C5CB0